MKRRLVLVMIMVIVSVLALCACQPKEEEVNYVVSFDFGYNTMVSSQICKSGTVVTPPAIPEREGYRFVKWQSGGQDFDLTQPITSDTMLRAVWIELKPITLVTEGNAKQLYIEPKDSYTLEDFDIDVANRVVAGLYKIVNGKAVAADIERGIARGDTLYVDTMTSGLTFEKVAGAEEYALTSVEDNVSEVALPVFYNGLPVTTLGANALHTNVIENIGGVDRHARRLDVLNLGAITIIDEGAISQVYIDRLIIPSTVTTIKRNAFAYSGIREIVFDKDSHVTIIETGAFMAMDNLETMKLPYGLTKLYSDTFISCLNLKKVYIPNTVVDIENFIFRGCVNMEQVYRQNTDGSIRIGKSWNDLGNGHAVSPKYVNSVADLDW